MISSEEKELVNMETVSEAVPEQRHNSVEGISCKIDEPGPLATQFGTPRRPAPR